MLDAATIGEFERQYLSLEANSAEEVSHWVSRRHKGFRSSPLERMGEGPVARFARAELDELSFVNFRWNRGFESEILEDLDAYFVCVPHAGQMKMQFGQKDEIIQTTENIRVFKRTAGLKNIVAAGYSNLSLVVPAPLLEGRLENWFGESLAEPLSFDPLVDGGSGQAQPITGLITHMLTLFNSAPECLKNEIVRANIKEHLLAVMVEGLPNNFRDIDSAQLRKPLPKAIQRAEEFMHAHCDRPLTLAAIAKVAGCSQRGLQHAFRVHRQKGPMSVLRDIRLEAAYNDILHTEDTITQVAYKWGFTNLGRFSAIFANKFGDSPSQIARNARHAAPEQRV